MTIDEGVAFALGSTQQAKPTPAVNHEPPPALTGRQLEIARLIADGLSNKQIAARLFLSERTVETHITNMLNKRGLNSRVQISRWIDQGPGRARAGHGRGTTVAVASSAFTHQY